MTPEWSTVLVAAITAVVTLVGTLVGAGGRSRREERRASARVDSLESWVYRARHQLRLWNDSQPPDTPVFHLPPLPEWMLNASDDEPPEH